MVEIIFASVLLLVFLVIAILVIIFIIQPIVATICFPEKKVLEYLEKRKLTYIKYDFVVYKKTPFYKRKGYNLNVLYRSIYMTYIYKITSFEDVRLEKKIIHWLIVRKSTGLLIKGGSKFYSENEVVGK